MNTRNNKKKMILGTMAGIGLISTSIIVASCSSIESSAGTKYIGDKSTVRYYYSAPEGNSYAGQPLWFTNPDFNYTLTSNTMGAEMNASTHNPLIRPVSIGAPNLKVEYGKNPSDPVKQNNEGSQTKIYYKFANAESVTISYNDSTTGKEMPPKTYTSDINPGPLKENESVPRNVPWYSVNSNENNVTDPKDKEKTFDYIMSQQIITKMSITINKKAKWSTNFGKATSYPVTSEDYWYGLQNYHLANPWYRFDHSAEGPKPSALSPEGNETWDTEMVSKMASQQNQKGQQGNNWNDQFTTYNIDADKFWDNTEPKGVMGSNEIDFSKDGNVNIPFTSQSAKGDGFKAWNGLFINKQLITAKSVEQVKINNVKFSQYNPGGLVGRYGFYTSAFAAFASFSNLLFATEFTCEALDPYKTQFHRAEGFQNTTKYKVGDKPIKNVIWNFSKQVGPVFAQTQYQKYIQGSTANMDQYSDLSNGTKSKVNENKNDMGVYYSKNIYSQLSNNDTTWAALIPGATPSNKETPIMSEKADAVYGVGHYNTGYTEAMFGKTLRQTYEKQDSSYFKHYYTYGTALRSSFSAAINWYTSVLNIYQDSKSNWGSNFAPNMPIVGKNNTPLKPGQPITGDQMMNSEYSYASNGSNLDNVQKVSLEDNKTQFVNNITNQSLTFQSAKFKQIQDNVKNTLDAIPNFQGTGENRIEFELPVRSFHNDPNELVGLENMRLTLNELDPRIHVIAKGHEEWDDDNNPFFVVDFEAYDSTYTMNWNEDVLPRLMSLRNPTSTGFATHYVMNNLNGLGGFLNDMLNFNQYGMLTGFSLMLDPNGTPEYKDGNLALLSKWVTGDFKTVWDNKLKEMQDKVEKMQVPDVVKKGFDDIDINNFHKAFSGDLVGPNKDGQNYSAFVYNTDPDHTNPFDKDPATAATFNGLFMRLLTQVSEQLADGTDSSLPSFTKMDEKNIKEILTGIDSYFGRSIEFIGRKIDNQDALPIILQKTWLKLPKPDTGITFSGDGWITE